MLTTIQENSLFQYFQDTCIIVRKQEEWNALLRKRVIEHVFIMKNG